MKTTPDQAAVAAIATAAFLAHNPDYSDDAPDCRFPERIAGGVLGFDSVDQYPNVIAVLDRTFAFALQFGARIGAEPLQRPEIKDLLERFSITQKGAA